MNELRLVIGVRNRIQERNRWKILETIAENARVKNVNREARGLKTSSLARCAALETVALVNQTDSLTRMGDDMLGLCESTLSYDQKRYNRTDTSQSSGFDEQT